MKAFKRADAEIRRDYCCTPHRVRPHRRGVPAPISKPAAASGPFPLLKAAPPPPAWRPLPPAWWPLPSGLAALQRATESHVRALVSRSVRSDETPSPRYRAVGLSGYRAPISA